MNKIIDQIKKDTNSADDLVFKNISLGKEEVVLVFSEVLCSADFIHEFILQNLSKLQQTNVHIDTGLESFLPGHNVKREDDYQTMLFKLFNGFTLLFYKDDVLSIETRLGLNRGISEATNEKTIRGPKDAFNEHFNTNLGLIRRRIKSEHLWMKTKVLGRETKTKVGLLYMENIIEQETLDQIEAKLDAIDIDGIIDSGYLQDRLETNSNHLFPTIMMTERPDRVAMSLLEGKIAILVDNSPYVLIIPSFFIDFFHTADDYYQKPINITFIRLIRLLAFFVAILIPAFYIAVTTHNHDAIPINLLLNFATQRETVPFPALIEALLMTLSFEILRESDTRMPSSMGTAVSILGGLVLGEAAVTAGLVSPIMIIVIAISAISGLVFSSVELISAVRWWRIIFMVLATFLGIYGLFLGGIILIANLASLNSFHKPYLAPFAPIIFSEQQDGIIRTASHGIKKRNPLLSRKNKIRGR